MNSGNGGVGVGVLNGDGTATLLGAEVEFDILVRNVAEERIFGGGEIGRLTGADTAVAWEIKDLCALLQLGSGYESLDGEGGSRSGECGAGD